MTTSFPIPSIQLTHLVRWGCLLGAILLSLLSFGGTLMEAISNFDFHHPGLMFAPALDLHHGLKPFREIVILYGYLSTYIQSLAIGLLGETLLSIWIITGIFYAVSLLLSYQVFCRLLTPPIALLTTGFLFLFHPYAIYPWPNYYWYVFILLAIGSWIRVLPQDDGGQPSPRQQAIGAALSGMALGAAILSRSSAIVATIAPPMLFFWGESMFSETRDRHWLLQHLQWLILGGLTVGAIFVGYCWDRGIWGDFLAQSAIVAQQWRSLWLDAFGYQGGSATLFLAGILIQTIGQSLQDFSHNFRLSIMSLHFFVLVVVALLYMGGKLRRNANCNHTDRIAFLLSLFALFAYTNAHLYEVFRLANGATIGFGVISYLLFVKLPQSWHCPPTPQRIYQGVILALLTALASIWLQMLWPFNQPQWNSYWDTRLIWHWPGHQIPAPALRHQRFPAIPARYYREIAEVLQQYDRSFIIVNDTNNANFSILSDKPRAYLMPAYISAGLKQGLGDQDRAQRAIASGKAIILTFRENDIPVGYQEVKRVWFREMPIELPYATVKILAKTRPDRLQ